MKTSLFTSFEHTAFSSSDRQDRLRGGFTLIEVLIAVFIFSVMGVTMFIVFNSTVGHVGAVDQSISDYEMGRICLDRMVADMASTFVYNPPLYSPPKFGDPPGPYRIVAETEDLDGITFSRFRFTSFSHLSFEKIDREDIAEIVYYVHAAKDGNLVLRRSDSLYPYPDFEEKNADPILCDRLRSLRLTFFDRDYEEFDEWNSESEDFSYATPSAIGIYLEFGDKEHPRTFETLIKLSVIREKYKETSIL
jgi:general secretion pathway protein J